MTIRTSKTALKFSRRAILKTLGLGAGFLPLLSTERARGATSSGFPRRLITIAVTDGICPPDFYTDGAGALPATLPFTLQPLAPWAAKLLLLRQAKTQGSPIDCNVMMDIGAKYGGHFTYPALLTGAVSSPNGTDRSPRSPPRSHRSISSTRITCRRTRASTTRSERGLPPVWQLHQLGVERRQEHAPDRPLQAVQHPVRRQQHDRLADERALARRKSVLDFVGGELSKFANNLGTDDKAKVQSHLQAIQSLESQLTSMSGTRRPAPLPPSRRPG